MIQCKGQEVGKAHPRNQLSQATEQHTNSYRFGLAGFSEPFSRDDGSLL
jgi:hypothetical protein